MGAEHEDTVREFLAELEGQLDADRVERVVGRMSSDARYHGRVAWHEPFVGAPYDDPVASCYDSARSAGT